MATDAAILSAARDVSAALADYNAKKQERIGTARADELALTACNPTDNSFGAIRARRRDAVRPSANSHP